MELDVGSAFSDREPMTVSFDFQNFPERYFLGGRMFVQASTRSDDFEILNNEGLLQVFEVEGISLVSSSANKTNTAIWIASLGTV